MERGVNRGPGRAGRKFRNNLLPGASGDVGIRRQCRGSDTEHDVRVVDKGNLVKMTTKFALIPHKKPFFWSDDRGCEERTTDTVVEEHF